MINQATYFIKGYSGVKYLSPGQVAAFRSLGYTVRLSKCSSAEVQPVPEELFIPLSWEGIRTSNYSFAIDKSTPTNYNTIKRLAGAQDFNNVIFSEQTFESDENKYVVGDAIDYSVSTSTFIGIGLKSNTGTNYTDIDFSMWIAGSTIYIFENGSSIGSKGATNVGEEWSWRIEYIAGTIKFIVNNIVVWTTVTGYVGETLCIKVNERNPGVTVGQHIAMVDGLVPNKYLGGVGDSITFGRAIDSGLIESNYVERTLAKLGNTYFSNPLLANSGDTTVDVIANQLPLVAGTYDATRDKNIYLVMIGINDAITGIPYATTSANIQTIVSGIQSAGHEVALQTILKDYNSDWPVRYLHNTDILNNIFGADYIIDHTQGLLETDPAYREVDKLHLNVIGNDLAAYENALVIAGI